MLWMWFCLGMSLGSSCFLLCISPRFNGPSDMMLFFPQFITNSFSPITVEKGPGPDQSRILQQASEYLSEVWLHLKSFCSQALSKQTIPHLQVPRTSHPVTVIEAFHLSAPLIHIQSHQCFLTTLSYKRFRPTQSVSLGDDGTTIFNANISE